MFFKLGFQNARRYQKISIWIVIFSLLLNTLISSGFHVRKSLKDCLKQCDEYYTSIGVLDYMGYYYPDSNQYDAELLSNAQTIDGLIEEHPELYKKYNANGSVIGTVEGLTRFDQNTLGSEGCVAKVKIMTDSDSGDGTASGTILEDLFSKHDNANMKLYINCNGLQMEKNHTYYIYARFYQGVTSYRYVEICELNNPGAIEEGMDTSFESMMVDVTEFSEEEEAKVREKFEAIANTCQVVQDSVRVNGTIDLANELLFYVNTLYMTEGELFTKEQYQNREKVCIISKSMAELLGFSVGDQISIKKSYGIDATLASSFWINRGYESEAEYTIVGLFDGPDEYRYEVYLPETKEGLKSYGRYSYSVGLIEFDNELVDEQVEKLNALLPESVSLTTYKGAYQTVSRPVKNMLSIVDLIVVLSIISGVGFLILSGYLYVYRQKRTIQLMNAMGTGKKNIYVTFLAGAGLISIVAAILGNLLGYFVTGKIMSFVMDRISERKERVNPFSDSLLSNTDMIRFHTHISFAFFAVTGIAVCIVTLLICLLFIRLSLQSKMKKVSTRLKKETAKTMSLQGGSMKYALISVKRGGIRSFFPIVLTLVSIILLFVFQNIIGNYEDLMKDMTDNYQISGHVTNLRGTSQFNLNLYGSDYNTLLSCPFIERVYFEQKTPYCFFSNEPAFDYEEELSKLPKSSYSFATFSEKMRHGSSIYFCNDLGYCSEFYYSSVPEITYMEGMDYEKFSSPREDMIYDVIVTKQFLEKNDVELGGCFVIFTYPEDPTPVYMRAVGYYQCLTGKDNIFIVEDNPKKDSYLYDYITLNSISFQLASPKDLDAVSTWLSEEKFSPAHDLTGNRQFVVIEDSKYKASKYELEQKIQFMKRLFPVLCFILECMAFFVAFAITKARTPEITTLKLMGAKKRTCFGHLFVEQLIMTLLSGIVGIGIVYFGLKNFSYTGLLLSILFLVLWNLGVIVSITKNICQKYMIYIQKDVM